MITKTNSWERYFFIASFLLLVSIPFGYFFSSLTFVIWSFFCLGWCIKCHYFKIDKALLPLLIFSLFSFASIIWSQDTPQTFRGISRQLPLFLFPIAGMCIPKISKEKTITLLKQVSLFLCFFALAHVLLAILKYNKYQFKDFLYYHELVSPFKLNAIYVSYIFATFFLFILTIMTKKQVKWFFVLLILGSFLVMLSSKMILFTTGLLALLIIGVKIKGRILKLLIIGFIITTFFGIFKFAKPIQDRFSTEFNTSFSEIINTDSFKKGRVYTGLEARFLQMRVFNEIVDTPFEYVFGVGLGASQKEIQEIHIRLNTPEVFQTYNFHNQYLQVLAELGIIGFILLVIVLGVGFNKSLKLNIFLPFIIITMTLFFTESVIWRQRGIMFFGIIYILLIKTSAINESKKQIPEV